MKSFFTFLFSSVFLINISFAGTKTWTGASSNLWSDVSNWSPASTPTYSDTIVISMNATITIDVNPNIEGLQILNNANVVFTSSSSTPRTIIIGNGGSPVLDFLIAAGSTLTLDGTGSTTGGVSIQTYGNFATTIGKVYGTLILGANKCTWNISSPSFSFTNTDIYGTVRILSTNTGSCISGATPATLRFANGAVLDWQRNGGAGPNANFQDGSLINVTGVIGSGINFQQFCGI